MTVQIHPGVALPDPHRHIRQPEQATNAARAAQLQVLHRVVTWRGDGADFQHQVTQAATQLAAAAPSPASAAGPERAQARIDAWVSRLLSL